MNSTILITCEHGGHTIPRKWRSHFTGRERLLESHRGWDYGALKVAKLLSKKLKTKLFSSEISRLVVDLNRSVGNPALHSSYIGSLAAADFEHILKVHYLPYRNAVFSEVRKILAKKNNAFHFSVHSFTPVLRGQRRDCQIGILFDPASSLESETAFRLKKSLEQSLPRTRIRYNDPYHGRGDGQTTALRKAFSQKKYSGIEIEMNQAWLKRLIARGELERFVALLAQSIESSV